MRNPYLKAEQLEICPAISSNIYNRYWRTREQLVLPPPRPGGTTSSSTAPRFVGGNDVFIKSCCYKHKKTIAGGFHHGTTAIRSKRMRLRKN
ncbi:hypothetical protein TNCV_303031 [Trichonephila clavipes]|nr:hypothetical protein TNCV_303031 [Trichonephila clavipes]